ncbi:MAG TPA: VanZ family protein [Pseudonocardiaceae bacterium]|nr:VanZ family protein [Pseudonocardiaceae bacterium]
MATMLNRVGPEIDLTRTIMGQPGVLAAFLLFCGLFGAGMWLVAGTFGWRRLPATLAAVGLSLAVAVTLVRSGGHPPSASTNPVTLCMHDPFSLHGGLQVLNFLMLTPFAFFGTLATRRPISVTVVSALVSGGIELTQAWTGLGVCQKQDFLNNTVGAVLAAGAAWVALMLLGRHERQPDRRTLERVQSTSQPTPETAHQGVPPARHGPQTVA